MQLLEVVVAKLLWGPRRLSPLVLTILLSTAFAQQTTSAAGTDQIPQQQPASHQTPASPQASVPAPVTPGKPVLEDGTPVKLRLARNVSSADAHVGDTVDFEVLEEVRVGDLLVIPRGGVAWGTVTVAEHKKRIARGGKLDMNVDAVRLVSGEKAALRAVKGGEGGGHTGAMTAGIVATGLLFFPAAPFFLFMHGKDVTIPKGAEITAYTNGNFPLDLAKLASPKMPEPASTSAATAQATMQIESVPSGADIELDGAFAGNTPSSLGIATGEHTIKITKAGYKPWERKIRISTGAVKLAAELEKQEALQPAAEAK
jgi:hypothetical protein